MATSLSLKSYLPACGDKSGRVGMCSSRVPPWETCFWNISKRSFRSDRERVGGKKARHSWRLGWMYSKRPQIDTDNLPLWWMDGVFHVITLLSICRWATNISLCRLISLCFQFMCTIGNHGNSYELKRIQLPAYGDKSGVVGLWASRVPPWETCFWHIFNWSFWTDHGGVGEENEVLLTDVVMYCIRPLYTQTTR